LYTKLVEQTPQVYNLSIKILMAESVQPEEDLSCGYEPATQPAEHEDKDEGRGVVGVRFMPLTAPASDAKNYTCKKCGETLSVRTVKGGQNIGRKYIDCDCNGPNGGGRFFRWIDNEGNVVETKKRKATEQDGNKKKKPNLEVLTNRTDALSKAVAENTEAVNELKELVKKHIEMQSSS
jgi:hypothetical protein